MADYSAEIAALKAAYAKGVVTVEYEGFKTTFASTADLERRIAYLEREQAMAANGGLAKPGRITYGVI